MQITKIKKIGKKYKIIIDNQKEIKTYDDVIINNKLLYQKNINPTTINKINNDTAYYDIYYKLVNYITKKLRSEKEIIEYIDKNKVTSKDKKEVIKKLKEIGLINDTNFLKAYIADKINLSTDGPYKIKRNLLQHNISEELIDLELNKISDEVINKKIDKLIDKKIKNSKYSGYVLKQKVINDLVNLGYDNKKIIEIYDSKNISNDINKEYNKLYNKYKNKYSGYNLDNMIKKKLYNLGFTIDQINNRDYF